MTVMLLGQSVSSFALPSDVNEPIRLLADKATYSESTGKATYSGNVSITQGTLKINAQNLSVNLSPKRAIESAIAIGNPASIQQMVSKEKGLAKGQAGRIEYNVKTGIVTLTGNARLSQNGASFSGNIIRYSLKVGDVEATSSAKQRVELVFPPQESNRVGVR
ncbi:lipopolysaccharide transport periplasmic protein LptA [Moraxella macacae]|nr:lipopolysaccharide transport periplasmic protein LptA [Moraxella macacae]